MAGISGKKEKTLPYKSILRAVEIETWSRLGLIPQSELRIRPPRFESFTIGSRQIGWSNEKIKALKDLLTTYAEASPGAILETLDHGPFYI